MASHERAIGFMVERVRDSRTGKGETVKLVPVDRQANERFVRKIFEAFADRDKRPARAPTEERAPKSG